METQEERRYSPPRIIAAAKTPIHGAPVEERICASHVERLDLDVQMKCAGSPGSRTPSLRS